MSAHLNWQVACHIIETLYRQGVTEIGCGSGARSSPLVVAAVSHPGIHVQPILDERSLAFFMLGKAKSRQSPTVVITTSGTAVANCLPAVIEAHYAKVPLLILSADRPSEGHDIGANQSIEQTHIFGKYVGREYQIPAPSPDFSMKWLVSSIEQAVVQSLDPPMGPIHINTQFRTPLLTQDVINNPSSAFKIDSSLFPQQGARTQYWVSQEGMSDTYKNALLKRVMGAQRGLIIVGDIPVEAGPYILKLAERIGWPIMAEMTSHLRLIQHPLVLQSGPLLMASEHPSMAVDCLLQFGSKIVSTQLLEWARRRATHWIYVSDSIDREDPVLAHSEIIKAHPIAFCRQVIRAIVGKKSDGKWVTEIDRDVQNQVRQLEMNTDNHWNEYVLLRRLVKALPEKWPIFCANSLPVRVMSQMGTGVDTEIRPCYANRGASGIDGTLSTAFGLASTQEQPLLVVIGDLSLIYDLNALFLLKEINVPVIILLVNNGGGGIFHHLNLAKSPYLDRHIALSHSLDFKQVAGMAGIAYRRIQDQVLFDNWITSLDKVNQHLIVDCHVRPEKGVEWISALKKQLEVTVSVEGA